MDQLNKLPRWTLVLCTLGFCGLLVLISGYLYAEGENTKHVAYQAKNSADTAQLQVASLSGQIQEIKNSNEIFRKEYREDQQRMFDKLEMISKKQ